MSNININFKAHTIEITKKFATLAQKFKSEQYEELKEARAEFPNYKIVIKSSKSKSKFKGLSYEYMENYIADHDNAEAIRAEYDNQREIAKCYSSLKAYNTIKGWFLEKYPEVKEFGEKKTDNSKEETAKSETAETTTIKMSEGKEIA